MRVNRIGETATLSHTHTHYLTYTLSELLYAHTHTHKLTDRHTHTLELTLAYTDGHTDTHSVGLTRTAVEGRAI